MNDNRDFEYGIMEVVRICDLQVKGSAGHNEQRVKCPYSQKHDFYVNTSKGTFKCWHSCTGCPGQPQGGMLDLYRLCHPECKSRGEAAEQIRGILFGNTPKGTPRYNEIRQQLKQNTPEVKNVNAASDAALDLAYRKMLVALPLKPEHRENLRKRGLTDQDIAMGMYRSIPSTDQEIAALLNALAGVDLNGVPGFYYDSNKQFHIQLPGYYDKAAHVRYPSSGFFIPSFNAAGQIFALQIRMDDTYLAHFKRDPKEAKRRRYLWFSSSCKDNGASAKNRASMGVVDYTPRNAGNTVYVTEGALKAHVAHCLNGQRKQFASIAGVNNKDAFRDFICYMKRVGCPVIDAFDMDRESNESVYNSIQALHQIAREEGWPMRSIKWDTQYKGIDDYLLHCKKIKTEKGDDK